MALKDIPKFEMANNVSISVYGYQEGKEGQEEFVYPLEVNERSVNLLLIADDDTNYYCFIQAIGRLVGSQYSKGKRKTHFCRFCLHGFSSNSESIGKAQHRRTVEEMDEKLKKHEERCFAFAAQRTEFPNDPVLKFENIQRQLEAPFTVYADFENILKQCRWEQVSRTYRLFLCLPNC